MEFARASFGTRRPERRRCAAPELLAQASAVIAQIPFAEDLLAAYYCAFDQHTPLTVKATLIGAIAYFVLPTDAIPDFIPVIGYPDDAAVLALAIKMVSDHIEPRASAGGARRLGKSLRPQNYFSHHLARGNGLERGGCFAQRIDRVHVRR